MKIPTKLFFFLSLLFAGVAMAQVPQAINYQASVRSADGSLIESQNVTVRFSVLRGNSAGAAVYVERHSVATNAQGLLSVRIGTGDVESGSFSSIKWSDDAYYLLSEIDPAGGANYTLSSCQQLVSVPYALYAERADFSELYDSIALLRGQMTAIQSDYRTLSALVDSLLNANNVACVPSNNVYSVAACDSFLWADGMVYRSSATLPSHTFRSAGGCDSTVTIFLTINHSSQGVDVQTFYGTYFTWIDGVVYTSSNDTAVFHTLNEAGCDSLIRLNLTFATLGALRGEFSVGVNRRVLFSKGNLQYQATTGYWRLATNQYDVIGNGNANIDSNYNDWIDLFGWATSGYHDTLDSANVHYMPYSFRVSSFENNAYGYGPSSDMTDRSLVASSARYDWGVYNTLINGGSQAGDFRTLTSQEWSYLLNSRSASTLAGVPNARYCKAKVNGVAGVILFPNQYTHPTTLYEPNSSSINNQSSDYSVNQYSTAQWTELEYAGCVFLPAAGLRADAISTVSLVNSYGGYWSTSHASNFDVNLMEFSSNTLSVNSVHAFTGHSVRRVKDVE